MTDSRNEIHDGLHLAAAKIENDEFDAALAEMTRLNDLYTIPPLANLIEWTRALKRKQDRGPEDSRRIVTDLRRVGVEMGP